MQSIIGKFKEGVEGYSILDIINNLSSEEIVDVLIEYDKDILENILDKKLKLWKYLSNNLKLGDNNYKANLIYKKIINILQWPKN